VKIPSERAAASFYTTAAPTYIRTSGGVTNRGPAGLCPNLPTKQFDMPLKKCHIIIISFIYLFIYLLFARNHQCDNHM